MSTYMPWTPWGKADYLKELGEGCMIVATPSHGGMFVPRAVMDKYYPKGVSVPSYSTSDASMGGVWYEEDCDMQLPLALLPVSVTLVTEEVQKDCKQGIINDFNAGAKGGRAYISKYLSIGTMQGWSDAIVGAK
jgi:hypothetical protein